MIYLLSRAIIIIRQLFYILKKAFWEDLITCVLGMGNANKLICVLLAWCWCGVWHWIVLIRWNLERLTIEKEKLKFLKNDFQWRRPVSYGFYTNSFWNAIKYFNSKNSHIKKYNNDIKQNKFLNSPSNKTMWSKSPPESTKKTTFQTIQHYNKQTHPIIFACLFKIYK